MKTSTAIRLLTASACTLSVISTFTAFLQAKWTGMTFPEMDPGPENYWSFRQTRQYSYLGAGSLYNEWWLADFWTQATYNSLFKQEFFQVVGPVFATMFLAQILTILLSAWSIIKPKPLLLLPATILSTVTISTMLFITQALYDSYEKNLQPGFYLAAASTPFFLAAFIRTTTTRQQTRGKSL